MDRRAFNKSLLAAGLSTALAPQALLAASQPATRIRSDIAAISRTGEAVTLPKKAVKALQKNLRGGLLIPGSDNYDTARQVWNGMIDKNPGLIVKCTGPADVMRAVEFSREYDLLVAVRGGGHSISGKSTCDGGIVIDTSPIRYCTVNPAAQTARLGAGSLLGDLDHEAQRFGLATPVGTVSHTGAGGLTLGGGHGRLSRSFGLTCDNVLSVDLVTADGRFVRASAEENPELYWGVRGGGGNFGVATAFEYQLHDIGTEVFGGPLIYPFDQARNVFEVFAEFTANAPREMAADIIALAPAKGQGFVILSICYHGDFATGEKLIQPVRDAMTPKIDQVGPANYMKMQSSADANTPGGKLYYNKSGLMKTLEPDFLTTVADRLEAAAAGREDPQVASNVIVQHLGGAVGDVPNDGTAYVHRDANYDSVILSAWENPEYDETNIKWLKDSFAQMEPYTIGLYSNHMVDSDTAKAERAFRGNYDRLVRLKNEYDPSNLFHLNANVKPTV
ncbi:MAG: FAD-binding oxidoreductase [Gammaproteobacteria bacterium]